LQYVQQRKAESWTAAAPVKDLRIQADPNSPDLAIQVYDPAAGQDRIITPTHWAFSQLCQYGGAPAGYLRKLPAFLAGIDLQWGLDNLAPRDNALVLAQSNGEQTLRAITSTSYGRIWDAQVVSQLIRMNEAAGGRWQVPAASYATTNPKRASTIYGSDRDIWVFLVDDKNAITLPAANGRPERQVFRGFIVWNSETGAQTFGLSLFLYDRVCDNRTIWGFTQISELRIRHTGGAPERFAYEAGRQLNRYAQESTHQVIETIAKAQTYKLPSPTVKGGVEDWLKARGFTGAQADSAVKSALAEDGDRPRSLWDIVQGLTASARTISHTDARIDLESKAGKLLKLVE
jgi:hypothetical protein